MRGKLSLVFLKFTFCGRFGRYYFGKNLAYNVGRLEMLNSLFDISSLDAFLVIPIEIIPPSWHTVDHRYSETV